MPLHPSRRDFVQGTLAAGTTGLLSRRSFALAAAAGTQPLEEVRYNQVRVLGDIQQQQRDNVSTVLMSLKEDALLRPFREMGGLSAPTTADGTSLGGWYDWNPDYDFHHSTVGLAPGSTFGQWTSAMARLYASSTFDGSRGDTDLAERVARLHALLARAITTDYFRKTRFAGYSFDKLVCGLTDAHSLAGDEKAFAVLDKVTALASPVLPGHAVPREVQWKPGADISWMWDETYTLPENLFRASAAGAGASYRRMARSYLLDEQYFAPLARGENVLGDKHAYSYVNSLCSAMQAHFADGSQMHLLSAINGFAMLEQQSFATGGWGPDELLRKPGFDEVAKSLNATHNSFETACGSYAHTKLARYLLRATRDGRYGDSMERVMWNTVLGALPLQPDGRAFYYADYNVSGKKVYSVHHWPCCSGTLPQVVADYGINTYLQSPGALWVVLYQPSEVCWRGNGAELSFTQSGVPWQDGAVRFNVNAPRPALLALHLRIPSWAASTTIRINGTAVQVLSQKGFTTIDRVWRQDDVVEVAFGLSLRLEPLPADTTTRHLKTVALLWGPLVLFALHEPDERSRPLFKEDELMRAERAGAAEWIVPSGDRGIRFVPFTQIAGEEYSTYVNLA